MSEKSEEYRKKLKRSKHYKGWYRFFYTLFLPLGRFLFNMKVIGRQNVPLDGKFIFAGNHRSWKDIPAFGFYVGGYKHFVSKEEHLEKGILRWVYPRVGVLVVNREKSDLGFMREAVSALNKNEPILIFPEGTRNRTEEQELLELKSGTALFAAKTGASIVPFIIYKTPKMFKKNYVYIAEPIKVADQPLTGMIDKELLHETALKIRQSMNDMFTELDELIANKQVKLRIKNDKKELKLKKKEYKAALKEQKKTK